MSDENDDKGNDGGGDAPKTVPYDRFQKAVQERNELRTKLKTTETEAQANAEKAATADTLAKQLETERADFAKKSAAWDTERAMIDAGLHDQEGRDVAQLHYGRLPEKDRPKIGDWLKATAADPAKAPKSLQPFLAKPLDPDAEGDEEEPLPAKRNTRTGADPTGAGSASAPLSSAKLREIRLKAQKTGDWAEWKRVTGQADRKA